MGQHILNARKYKETKTHKAQTEAANALIKDIRKMIPDPTSTSVSAAPVPNSP